jgi:hypothetical protein
VSVAPECEPDFREVFVYSFGELEMKLTKPLVSALASAMIILPSLSVADSQLSIGATGTTAQANLDFRIVIPNFIYFQIGSAGSIDRVDYDLGAAPAVEPGTGGPIAATGGTGDGVDGALTVTLTTNAASVDITATGGDLTGALGGVLPFADITASDTGTIAVPNFGSTGAAFAPTGSPTFTMTDTWSYTYDNTTVYDADTYDGRATYTVTVL